MQFLQNTEEELDQGAEWLVEKVKEKGTVLFFIYGCLDNKAAGYL